LKPKLFKTVVGAVRAVDKFDDNTMRYAYPSVAIKLGHNLWKCCLILKGKAIEPSDKKLMEDVANFQDLCDIEWAEEVSYQARKELYDRKRNTQKRLPLTATISAYTQSE